MIEKNYASLISLWLNIFKESKQNVHENIDLKNNKEVHYWFI